MSFHALQNCEVGMLGRKGTTIHRQSTCRITPTSSLKNKFKYGTLTQECDRSDQTGGVCLSFFQALKDPDTHYQSSMENSIPFPHQEYALNEKKNYSLKELIFLLYSKAIKIYDPEVQRFLNPFLKS